MLTTLLQLGLRRSDIGHGDLNFWLVWFCIWMPVYFGGRTFSIISHGVLVAVNYNRSVLRYVPLAAAEIKRVKRQWRLRWREGRLRPEVIVPDSPGLAGLFEGRHHGASDTPASAGPELAPLSAGPTTEKDAVKVVSVVPQHVLTDWRLWGIITAAVAGYLLALILEQPLFLLGLLAMPAGEGFRWTRYLVLTPDALWIAHEGREPVRIERGALKVDRSKSRPRLLTPHAAYPSITLSRFTGDALMHRVEHGDQPLSGAKGAPAPPPGALCSLCGRRMEASPAPGEVLICNHCQARTRLEAMDAGHGLTGRDRKPM